jgi:UDP:flavonoid glycosyltransferase YjiC (YdhE family)
MLPGALIAAEKSGRPSATIVHSVWFIPVRGAAPFGLGLVPKDGLRDRAIVGASRLAFDVVRPMVNRARRRLGLAPVRHVVDQLVRANRTLVLTDHRLDTPPEPLPEGTVYTGPEVDRDGAPIDFALPAGDEPLVLVALSTTDQHQTRALTRIAEAIALVDARAVITTGPVDPAELPASPKVVAVRYAPHATILRDAALIVTHGGHGTTMEALAAGVPLLFMPFGRDQPEIASRVVRRGAGLRVSRRAHASTIAAALRDLLDNNDHFRSNAATLARGIAEYTAADRVISELEALATL